MSGHGVGYGTPSPTTFPIPVLAQSGFGAGALQTQQAGPSGASPAAVGGTPLASASQARANQTGLTPPTLPTTLAPTQPAAQPVGTQAAPPPQAVDTWAPPPPSNAADAFSSTPTALDPGTIASQAAQTVLSPQQPTQAQQQAYQAALATYNQQEAAYQAQLTAYNASVAQHNSWQQQLNQMLATGLPGLQAAEEMLRQELGQPLVAMTATEPTYNPYSNIGPNGQPLPQGETPEQAYYIAHPYTPPPQAPQPTSGIVGNPTGPAAAAIDAGSGVGGVGTQLFGTGNTPGSLNPSYQAQVAAGGTGALAGLATSGVVPNYGNGSTPTVDIGVPYESGAGLPPTEPVFTDPLSGYAMPGYTAPANTQSLDTAFGIQPGTPDTTFTDPLSGLPMPEYTAAAPAESTFAQSLNQQWTAPPEAPTAPTPFVDELGFNVPPAPVYTPPPESTFAQIEQPTSFAPLPQSYGFPVDEMGFNQPPPSDLSLAQQQGFTTAGPGSGPGPVPSSADVAASKLQGAQTIGQALSALGATNSQLSQLGWIANTNAPIDLMQPLGPQLQAILPGAVYNMITDALAQYGVGTIDQLQQAIQAAQPNITPQGSDFSGQIAPQMGGYESNIGQFSTGVPPDYGAAPIPSVDIPQELPISGMAPGPMADSLQQAYDNADIGSLPQFLSGGLGLPTSLTSDPATMAALNNAAQALGISPAATGLNIMEESAGNPNAKLGSYYGLLQEAASQNPAYTVLDSQTAAALKAGNLSPADQLIAYLQQWLPGYNIPNRMANTVFPGDMSIAQQAAMMQGLQFAPNSNAWLNAIANNNQNLPATTSPQAANLGPNTYGSMTAAFNRMLAAHPPMLGTGGTGAMVGPPMVQ